MQDRKTIPIHPAEDADQDLGACSSGEPYALMVLGDSMLPEFEDGEIIVVEPEGVARDGSYVVAYHNDEYTFRQLVAHRRKWYLRPLRRRRGFCRTCARRQ